MELKDKAILLVEDDEMIGELYVTTLKEAGARVVWARNGEAGLRAAEENQPDLILSDLAMPKMDGYEMIEHLSKNPTLKEIPIIIITNVGSKSIKDKEILDGLGVDGYIAKTDAHPSDIINTISETLASRN